MLRDKVIKDEDCLTASSNILEQLTQEENQAAMPIKKNDNDEEINEQAGTGVNDLSAREKSIFRLGSLKTLTFIKKNIEFLETQAIQALSDEKAFKQLGYGSNEEFAVAFGMSNRTFYNLKKNVQTLGAETYIALRQAGYTKKNINFLAAQTEAKVEKEKNITFINIGDAKIDINDKEAMEDAIAIIEKEKDTEKKRAEKNQVELDEVKAKIAVLEKKPDLIPTDEKALDSEMGKIFTTISGLLTQAREIKNKISGKKNLEACHQANLQKINDHFMNVMGEMLG